MNINVYLTPNNYILKHNINIPKIEGINYVDYTNMNLTYCDCGWNWHHFDYKGAEKFFKDVICKYENINYEDVINNVELKEFNGFKYYESKNVDLIYKDIAGIVIETTEYKDITYYDNNLIDDKYRNKSVILASRNVDDFTLYHKQFLGSHIECKIVNKNSMTDKKLLLVTDSMSIPMIPFFISYYREIMYIDSRLNCKTRDLEYYDNIFGIACTKSPLTMIRHAAYIYQCLSIKNELYNGFYHQIQKDL